jgi:hypothetical protein
MGRAGAVTALAGAASGVLFLSLVLGAQTAPFVAYFVQLPLFFCGLAFGLASVTFASAGATLIAMLLGGFLAGAGFLLIEVAPAILVVRRAMLWREHDGTVEWYPAGRILAELTLLTAAIAVAGLLWLGQGEGGVEGALARLAQALSTETATAVAAAEFHALTVRWARWVPGIVAMSWMMMTILNVVLAQLLARRAGWARRPMPDIAALDVPRYCATVLAVALAAAVALDGFLGYMAAAAVLVFAVPSLFQGLAVVHTISRRRAPNRVPLIFFYVLLTVFSWPLVPLVVLVGLVDTWAGLRRRLA